MTLFRQLIVAILLLFVVLFGGNAAVSLHNNKLLVAEQMQVHAQDTATSLGLSMTQAAQADDKAMLETLFNAVSDSGYFQRIFFTNLQGEIIIDRAFQVRIEDVPQWFVSAIDIPSPEGKAQVAAGWIQLGEVNVVSHPGQAYLKLWQSTLTQLGWFALVTVLACLLAYAALTWLLVPLRKVEKQADAICERQFELQHRLPKTRELRRVLEAMNRMSQRLKAIFAEQLALINRLRERSSTDLVTGLPNRGDFDARFKSFLSPETGAHGGALMIVSLSNLAAVNEYVGREEGNSLLVAIAESLKKVVSEYAQAFVARRQGSEFAVFIPDIGEDEADTAAGALFQQVMAVEWPHEEHLSLSYHMGFSYQALMSSGTEMLSEADTALRQAKTTDSNQWCRFSDVRDSAAQVLNRPLNGWQAYLENCLEKQVLALYFQPVLEIDGVSLKAQEVFIRFPDDDRVISAGVVVPIAERLGMMPRLDLLMLKKLAYTRKAKFIFGKLVANLSLFSLQDETFMDGLAKLLKANNAFAKSLIIEVAEYGMDVDPSHIRKLQKLLHQYGAELAIDHFGLGATAFGYIGSLSLHHLKVHRSFISQIEKNPDNQFYVQSLRQLANNSNVELWVEGVETPQEAQQLQKLNVDAVQGYLYGKPSPNPVEAD